MCRTNGKCFLVRDKESLDLLVLKEMELSDDQMKACAFREVKLSSELKHPNIVEYKTHYVIKESSDDDGDRKTSKQCTKGPDEKKEDSHAKRLTCSDDGSDKKTKEKLCMVMEYCDGGDLLQRLIRYSKKGKTIREEKILKYLTQVLLAVEYIHSKNILHRDIKSQNIFLFADKHTPVKLGDFGISKELAASLDRTTSTVIGTPYYMSPEILSGQHYSFASDMWAVGCVLFEMMTLEHAFRGNDYYLLVQSIVKGQIPPLPARYSTELKALTLSLLSTDPASRPSAAQALGLPFIRRFMLSKAIDFCKSERSSVNSSVPPLKKQKTSETSQPQKDSSNTQKTSDEATAIISPSYINSNLHDFTRANQSPPQFPVLPPRLKDRAVALRRYCKEALGDEFFQKAFEYLNTNTSSPLSRDDPGLRKIIGEAPALNYAQALTALVFTERCLNKIADKEGCTHVSN